MRQVDFDTVSRGGIGGLRCFDPLCGTCMMIGANSLVGSEGTGAVVEFGFSICAFG